MPRVARPAVGYALTLAAAALFGINGTVSTLALEAGIPATRLTALRCTGAAVGLLVVLALVAPGRLRLTWREVPFLAVFGIVGVALTQFLYYVAIGRMPVGIALVFEMTAPVFIALYVWLVRREKVRSRLWLALLLSLSGLVLVAEVWQDGGSLDPIGVGAALIAALCLATYYLMGERGTVNRDPVALTCWSFVAAALFWAAAAPWWQFDPGVLTEQVPISVGLGAAAAVGAGRMDRRPGCGRAVLAVDLRAPAPRPDRGGARRDDRAGLRLDRRVAVGRAGAHRLAGGRRRRRPHRDRAGPDGTGDAGADGPAGDPRGARQLTQRRGGGPQVTFCDSVSQPASSSM